MEYKKSYKGFVIWMVLFIISMFACAFVPTEDVNLITLLIWTKNMNKIFSIKWGDEKKYIYLV